MGKKKLTHAEGGAIGGRAKNPNKGFGSNPELAKIAGKRGNESAKRNRKLNSSRRTD